MRNLKAYNDEYARDVGKWTLTSFFNHFNRKKGKRDISIQKDRSIQSIARQAMLCMHIAQN